jgi:fibronectin type 3 domain-containing protein
VAAVCVVAVCAGCAALRDRVRREINERTVQVTYDRPADLVPPEGLRVTSSEAREIALAWDPILYGDVGGYVVMRSRREGEAFEPVGRTFSRFDTVYTDRGAAPGSLGDGQTYYYRIHPFDSTGRVSRSHAFVKATTEPRPDPPEGLRAYSYLPRRVVLSWEPSAQRSITGYAVVRGPTVAGPWEPVAFVDGRLRTIYEDPVPGDLRVMYYRLQAVNTFEGESEMSEPVRAFTKAEPLPPLAPQVTRKDLGSIQLRWPRNVEPDIAVYEVWRSLRDGDGWGEESVIRDVDAPVTEALDTAIGCGQPVRYRLRAKDGDGLISGYSQALEAVGQDIDLVAEVNAGQVELRWRPQPAGSWPTARIYRRRNLFPDELLGEVRGAHRFALSDLPSGVHWLAVVLGGEPGKAAGATQSPACEIEVRIP